MEKPMEIDQANLLGSKLSRVVRSCQICESKNLEPLFFLGYLPPVNTFPLIGERPKEEASYPAELLYCPKCTLVQLGLAVDPTILFPPEYAYTSSTTRILRENFAGLYRECSSLIPLKKEDLIVDIGSNDGNLLSNFQGKHRVQGVTPEEMGKVAIARGIPTIIDFFGKKVAGQILKKEGKAKIITATNVFAHIDNINGIVECILSLLDEKGVFISESHYLLPLVETLQYDTIYHEHLRYYSLHSLKYLLERHGLEIFHARQIPTHGGSVRVYAARKGQQGISISVSSLLEKEKAAIIKKEHLLSFKERNVKSKLSLLKLLAGIKEKGQKIYGISAPSRAVTLVNYVGLDDGILDCILEIEGSKKIGKCMPGTLIPVLEESKLFEDQPQFALLLSWHIADELIPKLREKGYKGKFIIPLPLPRIVD